MSKNDKSRRPHQNWSLIFMVRDGARVSKDGRDIIFARAQEILGAKNEEEEVLVGADHRAIATAEAVLRELSLDAEGAIMKGEKPFHAWKGFNSFRRGVLKLSYLPHPQRNEEQSEESEAA